MKKLIATLVIIVSQLGLVACNTVEGMGKDMQEGGKAIQNAANDDSNSAHH